MGSNSAHSTMFALNYCTIHANLAEIREAGLILQQVELFNGLSTEELEALSASSSSRSFPKNTVVIHENDPADSLFIIENGRVKVYCSDKNGKEFIMNTQGEGDYFGELALLDDSSRSASVRTVEKSTFSPYAL